MRQFDASDLMKTVGDTDASPKIAAPFTPVGFTS